MIGLYTKTIVMLNLRFADFYSSDLFEKIKARKNIRIVAVVDHQFKDKIPAKLAKFIDKIYELNSNPKMGFLGEFEYADLCNVIESEQKAFNEIVIACSDEFNLMNAGRLRDDYSLYGHNEEYLSIYRDKVKMKKLLSRSCIRVPGFKLLHETDHFDSLQDKIGCPFVVKPVDSCGSHGVSIIRNIHDFYVCMDEVGNKHNQFEVEEFIDGQLYHVDSFIKDGELKFICASEYAFPNYDYTQGKVLASIPLDVHSELSARLIEFSKKCLDVFQANNIINHMELFVKNNGEIVFLEVSGRPPGAFLNLTHQINFGVNLIDEDLFLQTGIEVDINAETSSLNAFFAMFPLLPGRVVDLIEPKVQSTFDMKWHIAKNDVITEDACKNIVGKSAHAVFYHHDLKVLRQDFDLIKQFTAVEVA